jgi:hypothetical protein
MELEFDKEIDALLRKGQLDSTAATGGSGMHLDAADISAFAENVLPERAKQLYTAHLAECGRCRKILSQTIALNLEAEPVAASSDVVRPVVEESLPWYRRLLRLPDLAYGMGALVLLFSGFLGYTVYQSMSGLTASSDVSQVTDTRSAPVNGPNAGEDQYSPMANTAAASNASNSVSSVANSAANALNTAGASSNSSGSGGTLDPVTAPPAEPRAAEVLVDGVITGDQQPAAAAPPPAKDQPEVERDEPRLAKEEAKNDAMDAAKRSDDMKVMREKSRSGPAKKPADAPRGDSRTQQTSPMLAGRASNARQVSGRSFERKEGVWYDTAYRGQATINISRGTESYRKLDSGLRTIAESLDGIVVALWKNKAYRIQ